MQNTERNPGVLLSKLVSFPTNYTFQVCGKHRMLLVAVRGTQQYTVLANIFGCSLWPLMLHVAVWQRSIWQHTS